MWKSNRKWQTIVKKRQPFREMSQTVTKLWQKKKTSVKKKETCKERQKIWQTSEKKSQTSA